MSVMSEHVFTNTRVKRSNYQPTTMKCCRLCLENNRFLKSKGGHSRTDLFLVIRYLLFVHNLPRLQASPSNEQSSRSISYNRTYRFLWSSLPSLFLANS